ncbi:MAG: helix-turn-helix domain-containing protein [Actinobacteria bacterium]|nr:helix-turn-helix domain-containing protein [Actinomycetota bacterium]
MLAQPAKGRRSRERFPAALRGLMEERRLSYRQLAYKTRLSAGYLNHLTKGSRPVPADPVIESLAHALHVEPDYFMEFRLRRLADVLGEAPILADQLYGILLCEAPVTSEVGELLSDAARADDAEDAKPSNVVSL